MTRVCSRCRTPVTETTTQGYAYYCPEHDEDLYEFETTEETNNNEENNKMENEKNETRNNIGELLDAVSDTVIERAVESAKNASPFIKSALYVIFCAMRDKADETIAAKEQEKGEPVPEEIKALLYGDAILVAMGIVGELVDIISKGDDADAGTNE